MRSGLAGLLGLSFVLSTTRLRPRQPRSARARKRARKRTQYFEHRAHERFKKLMFPGGPVGSAYRRRSNGGAR